MIKVDAFIALEASLATRLSYLYSKYGDPVLSSIEDYIAKGQWDLATQAAGKIDLRPTLEDAKPYILYITNLSMLFGASRVTSRPGTTTVGLGYEGLTIQQAVDGFVHNSVNNGNIYLQQQAVQLIALRKANAEAGIAEASVPSFAVKSDSYSAVNAGPTVLESSLVQKAPIDKSTLTSYDPKQRILLPFSSFMDEGGKAYFNMVSSLHTSRVSAYGFTAEAYAMGLTEYSISAQLDKRICPVCRLMHGKTFDVKDAKDLLNVVLRVQDKSDLVQLQPWPSQSKAAVQSMSEQTPDELVAAGWHIPPFHPRCRCLLTKVGKVPPMADVEAGTVKDKYVATEDDFSTLGINATQKKVDTWNKAGLPAPAEVIANLTGTSPDVYLQKLVLADNPAEVSGVKSLNIANGVVKLNLDTTMYGSNTAIQASMQFDPKKGLSLTNMTAQATDQTPAILKAFMKGLYGVAQDAELAKLIVSPAQGYGSYGWAKAGFMPATAEEWQALKKSGISQLKKTAGYAGLDDLTKQALTAIEASTDPADVFALADLSVGEAALTGIQWDAALHLDDPEAVAKFLDYFKG